MYRLTLSPVGTLLELSKVYIRMVSWEVTLLSKGGKRLQSGVESL